MKQTAVDSNERSTEKENKKEKEKCIINNSVINSFGNTKNLFMQNYLEKCSFITNN